MGTPDFAVPSLERLCEQCEIIAVVTQPDRPKGRGQKRKASPVKEFATEAGLEILQPEKVKTPEFTALLKDLQPDLIIVVAFGQILSKEILAIPPLGCINVHASLLPRYRGAAPIHWSIINGEKMTGVTTMFMDVGLDTGDMILRKECNISQEITTGELHDHLMRLGADLLGETITLLKAGKIVREAQDGEKSTYAPLLTKATEKIDWSLPADRIHDLVRGLTPWPGAYCLLHDKILKIWRTKCVVSIAGSARPGEVLEITSDGFLVAAGTGALEILELQPASKRKMSARDYVCGGAITTSDRLV